jgi:hypothetical protein
MRRGEKGHGPNNPGTLLQASIDRFQTVLEAVKRKNDCA